MSRLEIYQFPMFSDNYGFLLHDPATGDTAVVDPGDAPAVKLALQATEWRLTLILNTHHHADHAGGNLELKALTGAEIVAPEADRHRIPGVDRGVRAGDEVMVGTHRAQVFETYGHTVGHIAYWFAEDAALFCGDTLFALGCGRLFEGTPQQMWRSLTALRALPPETRVYCAHEYTASNCRFALTVEPGNSDLVARAEEIRLLRESGVPTVPSSIRLERATNPFLRADVPELQAQAGLTGMAPEAVFAEIRRRKDNF